MIFGNNLEFIEKGIRTTLIYFCSDEEMFSLS